MIYLLLFRVNNQYYLRTSEGEICAYKSLDEVMAVFSTFTEWWTKDKVGGRSHEFEGSACIAMMNIQPFAIEAPDNAEDLEVYVESFDNHRIWGGNIGKGFTGIKVKSEIESLIKVDIWKQSMQIASTTLARV